MCIGDATRPWREVVAIVVLGRKANLALFGGPDFVAQVEHKLRAYTWNIVHRYEVELVIDVCEIGVDRRGRCARFSSRRGFAREAGAAFELQGDVAARGSDLSRSRPLRRDPRREAIGVPLYAHARRDAQQVIEARKVVHVRVGAGLERRLLAAVTEPAIRSSSMLPVPVAGT